MFRSVLFLFGFGIVLYTIGFFTFTALVIAPFVAPDRQVRLHEIRFDGGVVFSGDVNRIDKGFVLLNEQKVKKLLISGVGAHIRIDHIFPTNRSLARLDAHIRKCCIALGTHATNTMGNVEETLGWAEKHHIKTLALITSDYHMPRSRVIFFLKQSELEMQPVAVRNVDRENPLARRNIAFLLKVFREYSKTLLTILWLAPEFLIDKTQRLHKSLQ